MRFVDGFILEDEQLDVGISQFIDFGLSFDDGARVILAANSDELHQFFGIIEFIDFSQCLTKDTFFMPCRQQNSKGETGITIDRRRMIQPGMLSSCPDKETQAYIEDGLKG